jgi:hypothetical protein
VVHLFLYRRYEAYPVWEFFGAGLYSGSDQLALYGMRSYVLSGVALLFGLACFLADAVRRWWERESWHALRLPFELYFVAVFATYLLPDALRIPLYPGWIGALAARLTAVTAVMGLCVMATIRPRKWHTLGFSGIAVISFVFLYQDTEVLNRMERQAEFLVSSLPAGERVSATIWAPPDSRVPFVVHIVDRACIGRCFSFENYEPSSGQFRVRVQEGSPLVTDDTDASEAMQAGEYLVQPGDLPMAQIYQCDDRDWTQLCVRQLTAGEKNGRLGYHPRKE